MGTAISCCPSPIASLSASRATPRGSTSSSTIILALWSGALWGKPTWGTYWVWDARLTSELVLLFLYFGFIALANAFEDPRRGDRAALGGDRDALEVAAQVVEERRLGAGVPRDPLDPLVGGHQQQPGGPEAAAATEQGGRPLTFV